MNWGVIWRSLKNSDMQKRLLGVSAIILIFRVLAHIPIPLSNPETLKQVLENLFSQTNSSQLLSFLNVVSGGALANFSIVLIGLGPYINASIIMQLLTKAIPKLEVMSKEGEYGRKKINQYTRILAFPLAIIQSIGSIYLVRQSAQQIAGLGDITANTSLLQWALMIASLTGGAMLLMWMGELITEKGIGNGISLLITVGIVASLPGLIASFVREVFSGGSTYNIFGWSVTVNRNAFLYTSIILIAVILLTYFVVKLNEAARKITIHYAKRVQGNRAYGGVTTILPVKMITAGVIPIIFAVAFLSIPSFVGQILSTSSSQRLTELGQNLVTWFETPSPQTFAQGGLQPYIYPLVYFLLVVLFTYFYTGISFNSKEIAENLQKQGGFIEGIRSGLQTEKYLGKVVNRLTLFGSISLGLLAITPIIAQAFLNTNISIGGTSILILVAVSLETLRQLESRALMVTYDDYSTPDFFYGETEEAASQKNTKKSRKRLFRRKKEAKKSTERTQD